MSVKRPVAWTVTATLAERDKIDLNAQKEGLSVASLLRSRGLEDRSEQEHNGHHG
jgi:hypothetical protein